MYFSLSFFSVPLWLICCFQTDPLPDGPGFAVVGAAVQLAAGLLLVRPAPLLEEHRHVRRLTLPDDVGDPLLPDRPGAGSALAADDRPVDARQVHVRQRAEERLDRQELGLRPGAAQVVDAERVVGVL